ncbi:fimbria/pilus outer membrane usher protein [Burkholderia ambifaria]|uniref:fimbria/pilus outer membrane usher protein n=1 Tax=Burkholderia ambifaria TaxID=152480 RepID=UPI001592259A|nr:fimbria/pilus outer membrane usher protein [Burkholderia ambifaria]
MFAIRLALSLSFILCIALESGRVQAASDTSGSAVAFDTRTLVSRGYSADIASFFSSDAKFLPGRHDINVTVNASRKYAVSVQFDNDGAPCFDAALLAALRLRHDPGMSSCVSGDDLGGGARVKSFPGQFRIELTVPESAFDPEQRDNGLSSGGTAALLNYDVFAQRLDGRAGSSQFFQTRLESGFNVGNWIFRNRGTLANTNEGIAYRHQDAYVARTVESIKSIAQVGQVNTAGDIHGGLPMLGFQIGSNSLQSGSKLANPIQGIAESNATVEVRQRGRVVYRTIVPPGPFVLSDIGAVAQNANVEIEITEEDGRKRRFDMPVGMGYGDAKQPTTWQAAVGRYRNTFDDAEGKAPLFVMGEVSFSPLDTLRMTTAALASPGYLHAAAQATLATEGGTWIASGLRYSNASDAGHGYQLDLQGSTRIGTNLFASASWSTRSNRYTSPDDGLGSTYRASDTGRPKHAANASVSWAHPRWGSLSYGLSYGSYFGAPSTISHTISAGRRFGRVNVSVAAQMSSQGRNSIYANLSIPLGGGTLSARGTRSENGQMSFGSSYSNRFGRDGSYTLGASGSQDSQRLSASASMRTGYAQLGAGISQSTNQSRSVYLSAAGALVLANGSLGTASSRVGDTFAMVKVPGRSGLRISAPGGTAVTNAMGTAVIPTVTPYSKAALQIDSRSLPMNVRLDTTTLDVALTRGSVVTHEINATEMRQLLLSIRDASGKAVPLGTSVLDEQGGFIGTIVGEGNFMLTNDDIAKPLRLSGANGSACRVIYHAPEKFDPNQPYEEADGTCE